MNYIFTVDNVTVDSADQKCITHVNWSISFIGEDGSSIGNEWGITHLEPMNQETFIEFQNLTPSDIEGWVIPKLNVSGMYEACIARNELKKLDIEASLPETVLTPPWLGGDKFIPRNIKNRKSK